MEKIEVRICSGTTCYVMGGSDLLLLEDALPDHLKSRVEIVAAPCLEYCHSTEKGKAPFVVVDGFVISEATVTKIIAYLDSIA